MPDYTVENHGTLFLVRPETDAARQHLSDHVEEAAQWWCGALVVEPRYVYQLAFDLGEAGYKVA